MSGAILEAKAVITGVDKVSPLLEEIAQRISRISRMSAEVGRTASSVGSTSGVAQLAERIAAIDSSIGHMSETLGRFGAQIGRTASAIGRAAGKLDETGRASAAVARTSGARRALHRIRHGGHELLGEAVPLLAAGGAGAELHGLREGLVAAAERQHVRVGMMNAGMPLDEIDRAEALAMKNVRNAPNLSVSSALELHKEVRSAVQHPEEAFELMPDLAKAASILRGMGAQNANIADIVKGGESLGLMNDPQRFHRYLEGQVKAMAVMGHTIDTTQIYESAKYSKSAGATLSDRFLNTVMPSLIQEMHGSSAGDALAGLTKTLRGGLQHMHLPVEKLNELGMLEDPSKIRRAKKTGQIMGYSGKLVGDELIATDPDKFAAIFEKHAEAHGYKTLADKTRLANETLPRTAANLLRIFLQQRATLEQHARNYEAAPGLDQSVENQRADPTAALGALEKAISSFAATLGSPIMADAAKAMSFLANGIGGLGESLKGFQKDHPDLAKVAAGGAIAGGAAIGGGLLAVAFKGLTSGFGLSTSAVALDGSAAALTAAAVKLGGGSTIPGAAKALDGASKGGWLAAGGRLIGGIVARSVPIILGATAEPTPDKDVQERMAAHYKANPGSHASIGGYVQDIFRYLFPSGAPAPLGSKDYTLGDRARFKQEPITETMPGTIAPMSARTARLAGADAPTARVTVDQPPPIHIEIAPSSALIAIVQRAEAVQLKLRADTGVSMPETSPGGKMGHAD